MLTYSGYAGDLSPQLTLEILTGKEDALLIDIRPEARDNPFGLVVTSLQTTVFKYSEVSK